MIWKVEIQSQMLHYTDKEGKEEHPVESIT
jgi:hypothetical protein